VPALQPDGYRGRIGIFQLLIMNDELEALAAGGASRTRSSGSRRRTHALAVDDALQRCQLG